VNDVLSKWQAGRRRSAEGAAGEGGEPAPGCLSDLALDRLTLSEGTPQERAEAQAHLQGCRACADAFAWLGDDRRRFAAEADVPALARDALARAGLAAAPARARPGRWLAPVLGLAAAGAGFLLWARGDGGGAGDVLRAKGGFAIELYVQHAETPGDGKLHVGELLHPADRVRLRLSGDGLAPKQATTPVGRAHVAVLALDTTGRVSVYHPSAGTTATPVEGERGPLPGAIELDGTLGPEVIVAFSCPGPVAVDSLVAAVQKATDRARVSVDPAEALGPLEGPCVAARYRIAKAPPGGPR
jgi:hypothetical protein